MARVALAAALPPFIYGVEAVERGRGGVGLHQGVQPYPLLQTDLGKVESNMDSTSPPPSGRRLGFDP